MRFRDLLLYTVAILLIVGGGLGVVDAIMTPGSTPEGGTPTSVAPAVGAWLFNPLARVSRVNLLLIGTDDRVLPSGQVEKGRADTIIMVSLSPANKRAAVFSIPRDLLVRLPGVRGAHEYPQKINHAYVYGDVPLIKRTVERELGMRADYYARVDLEDFVEVVDILGGVELEVPDIEGGGRGMNYDDSWGNLRIRLKPGYQHLDGEQAMGFVRYRRSNYRARSGGRLGISDLQRHDHQQTFLKAMVEQKLRASNLPALLRAGGYIMQHLDTDLDWRTAVALMQIFRGLDTQRDLLQVALPLGDRMIGGIYYCEMDGGKLEGEKGRISAFLAGALDREGEAEEARPSTPAGPQRPLRVRVLNGCGVPGAARRAVEALSGAAVYLESTGNAASFDHARTLVEHRPGLREAAQRTARELGVSRPRLVELPEADDERQPDLIITLGRDYES